MFELIRFGLVGGFGVVCYVAGASILTALGVTPWIASLCTYLVLIPIIYTLQRNISFRSDRPHRQAFPRYVGAQICGLTISTALPAVATANHIVFGPIPYTIVAVISAGASYLVMKLWAFAPHRTAKAPELADRLNQGPSGPRQRQFSLPFLVNTN